MGEFQSSLGLVKNVSVLKMKHLSMPMSLTCIYFIFDPVYFYFTFFKKKIGSSQFGLWEFTSNSVNTTLKFKIQPFYKIQKKKMFIRDKNASIPKTTSITNTFIIC